MSLMTEQLNTNLPIDVDFTCNRLTNYHSASSRCHSLSLGRVLAR